MKKTLCIVAAVLLSATPALRAQEKTNDWFIQPQLGITYSEGKAGIGSLLTPGGQLSVGKYFTDAVGARLAIGGWQGKGNGSFYYGSATIDGLFDLSTMFAGSNATRKVSLGLIAGIGMNRQFSDNENGFMGRLGLQMRVRLNSALDFNTEFLANGTSDRWNGLDDHGFDRYYSLLFGVSYRLGHAASMACPDCEKVYYHNPYCAEYVQSLNDKINKLQHDLDNFECPTPAPVQEAAPQVVERHGIRSHVLFGLARTDITADQEMNIKAIADYMKQYPESKASVTGYADKGTGTAAINRSLAQRRAAIVSAQLTGKYGIDASRLTVDSRGDEEQPFEANDWNRVVIMIAD